MNEVKLPEIKTWRKKYRLSQKKLADLAKVSLATLRQVEIGGKHKPHKTTLRKIASTIEEIQKKNPLGKTAQPVEAVQKPEVEKPEASTPEKPKKKDRKLKKAIKTIKPPRGKKAKAAIIEATQGRQLAEPAAKTKGDKGYLEISNLDLELMNRILRMTNKEKLELLQKLV